MHREEVRIGYIDRNAIYSWIWRVRGSASTFAILLLTIRWNYLDRCCCRNNRWNWFSPIEGKQGKQNHRTRRSRYRCCVVVVCVGGKLLSKSYYYYFFSLPLEYRIRVLAKWETKRTSTAKRQEKVPEDLFSWLRLNGFICHIIMHINSADILYDYPLWNHFG